MVISLLLVLLILTLSTCRKHVYTILICEGYSSRHFSCFALSNLHFLRYSKPVVLKVGGIAPLGGF